MEHIVYDKIYQSLESTSQLSGSQYGYCASRGTNDAVFKFVNDVFISKDKGEHLQACFLDVRKAFDSIHHLELLSHMKQLNLSSIYTDWLYAYLKNCTQRNRVT